MLYTECHAMRSESSDLYQAQRIVQYFCADCVLPLLPLFYGRTAANNMTYDGQYGSEKQQQQICKLWNREYMYDKRRYGTVQPYPHRCVPNLEIFHLLTESLKPKPHPSALHYCAASQPTSFPPAIASPFPYGLQPAHPQSLVGLSSKVTV